MINRREREEKLGELIRSYICRKASFFTDDEIFNELKGNEKIKEFNPSDNELQKLLTKQLYFLDGNRNILFINGKWINSYQGRFYDQLLKEVSERLYNKEV